MSRLHTEDERERERERVCVFFCVCVCVCVCVRAHKELPGVIRVRQETDNKNPIERSTNPPRRRNVFRKRCTPAIRRAPLRSAPVRVINRAKHLFRQRERKRVYFYWRSTAAISRLLSWSALENVRSRCILALRKIIRRKNYLRNPSPKIIATLIPKILLKCRDAEFVR